ncbi:MAG TPA: amino acid ABC transporter permease [Dictyoglomaceae bacterium]|nr:amino acid ABC transporter permease [Dictyoglomaceae bacterium]HOL38766.1 amino acid ABC transporter permease [Dictyoglomaceae bacterium]HOP94530.1 amino acid ABC transporter permease [Dictyoglomaceae bacterium]HPP15485.1 amino acid ABC transporter permease [Dictyoglomaceae bacterium]HPU43106.1 amino acid ABC transporter permease [Dictyoglomaceae bacterium]
MDFNWSIFWESIPYLLKGAALTLRLSLISVGIGIILGLLLSLLRISKIPLLRVPAAIYVEVLRGTPLLMQLLIIYYALPSLGLNLGAVTSAIVGLSLNSTAYIGEIFRGGIQSIEKGQMEAARSLGMTYLQAMRYVILPQAFRRILPSLTNEFVAMLKDSSLASNLAVTELLRAGREIVAWKANVFSPFIGVALIYLIMTFPLTRLSSYMEKRLKTSD